jgi:hypothetical protein
VVPVDWVNVGDEARETVQVNSQGNGHVEDEKQVATFAVDASGLEDQQRLFSVSHCAGMLCQIT